MKRGKLKSACDNTIALPDLSKSPGQDDRVAEGGMLCNLSELGLSKVFVLLFDPVHYQGQKVRGPLGAFAPPEVDRFEGQHGLVGETVEYPHKTA